MNNNVITTSPNIEGNIGSCEIKSREFGNGTFHNQTIAVNSCTGEIVADNTYFGIGTVILILALVSFIVPVAIGLALEIRSNRSE